MPLPIGAIGCPPFDVHGWSMSVIFADFDFHSESRVGSSAYEHAVLTGVILESVYGIKPSELR